MTSQIDMAFFDALADVADAVTMARFRQPLTIDTKDKPGFSFDPVTDADRDAELAIRDLIGSTFPDHSILGEEFGAAGDADVQWVIDPIDGSRPFLCGLPVWGTLIGLTVGGVATQGMMSQPFTRERFWGGPDGAWSQREGMRRPLHARPVASLADAVLHTTSPEGWPGDLMDGFGRLKAATRMTRYGGECYAMAMVAAGQIDLAIEPSLQPYDIVALIPIIEQAGGVVTRLDGKRAEGGGPVLLSANAALHDLALRCLAG
ncbi:histidinol phosphatase-like enzyme (inositol monophosphatase family) [Brevundimonas vesicularis]|uniref:histidinol-phosphatase n=1 Tax=Brevundimonas vesicularis TaxID=41276 RepID=UPI0018EBE040|nr:histidinol-phosphatase [Brevundimonas vesicularis]MDQ1193868.1 histidinol phosphatase-like enzyme (inositol monophosphatase family) [Brevundimonas vesicularis]